MLELGSPPRAWGIRVCNSAGYTSCRFTPTCVGIRYLVPPAPANGGSPPRAWEYQVMPEIKLDITGSPPRAWGILADGAVCRGRVRFTPTCVGILASVPC